MASITLNFQVHQPFRIATFQPDGSITNHKLFTHYFNQGLNKWIFDRVATKCYLPANETMLQVIDDLKKEKRKFKVSYSVSGAFLEACEMFNTDVLESFKRLGETGCVEFIGESYYHSLSSLFESKGEFIEQVNMHRQILKDLLNFKPKSFKNTEMIYNNLIAKTVEDLGFKAIFTESIEGVLGWRCPNYVYTRKYCFPNDPKVEKRIRVLLRNYRLSDDIAYRFSSKEWDQWPLTAEKFAAWLNATPGQVINLFLDYETFGEHQREETGIFWFLKALPYMVLRHNNLEFLTPSEVVEKYEPTGEVDVFELSTISWADIERDTSAWLGNRMQQICFEEIKNLESLVKKLNAPEFTRIWRLLQLSDHYYYACTKWWNDGDVHKYFSSFATPQDMFINFMGIISDFKARVMMELIRRE